MTKVVRTSISTSSSSTGESFSRCVAGVSLQRVPSQVKSRHIVALHLKLLRAGSSDRDMGMNPVQSPLAAIFMFIHSPDEMSVSDGRAANSCVEEVKSKIVSTVVMNHCNTQRGCDVGDVHELISA
eukprot:766786-Hanusia_phi.AAC.10